MKFYLKNPSASSSLIMMRVYDPQFANRRFVYSTKEHIDPKNWNDEKEEAKKGFEHINTRLSEISRSVSEFIVLNRKNLTKAALKCYLERGRPKEVLTIQPKTLLEECQEFLEIVKGNVSSRTYLGYEKSYKIFEEYLQLTKLQRILPVHFDLKNYQRYRSYLKQKYASENTVSKRIKHVKMMIVNQGVHIGMNPDEMKTKETVGLQISLSQSELEKLMRLKLEGRLARVRDLFVVQCHTGVRVSDLFRLDKNIKDSCFEFEQKKD